MHLWEDRLRFYCNIISLSRSSLFIFHANTSYKFLWPFINGTAIRVLICLRHMSARQLQNKLVNAVNIMPAKHHHIPITVNILIWNNSMNVKSYKILSVKMIARVQYIPETSFETKEQTFLQIFDYTMFMYLKSFITQCCSKEQEMMTGSLESRRWCRVSRWLTETLDEMTGTSQMKWRDVRCLKGRVTARDE